MNRLLFIFLLFTLNANASPAQQANWLDNIQLHGFASQAFIYTTDNDFFGDSDHGSTEFTELGLNASLNLSSNIRASGQLLSRRAGKINNGSPRIDFALLDINLATFNKGRLGAYIGRVKNPIGLYNETRDVAHTRQGVFVPQVIYADNIRNLLMATDGAHLYGELFLPMGSLHLQAGIGYPNPDGNMEYAYMGKNWPGELNGDNLALMGRLMYEHDGGRWIFSASGVTLELDYDQPYNPSTPPPLQLNSGKMKIDYSVLSAQYNGEKWQLTTEIGIQDIEFSGLGGIFEGRANEPFAYMVEANYRFTPNWQGFIRHEMLSYFKDDKFAYEFAQRIATLNAITHGAVPLIPNYTKYSKSISIGGRWDITRSVMARAEYHWLDGTGTLTPRENDMNNSIRKWDMFAISLSYRF